MDRIVENIESIAPRIRNRYLYYTKILPFAKSNASQLTFNSRNTIALFCNPRGGSTWLSDLISLFGNSASANEPEFRGPIKTDGVMPHQVKKGVDGFEELNFWYYQPIPENDEWPEAVDFMTRLLNREIMPLSVWFQNDIEKIPDAELFIYKFCYANLFLPWFCDHFDVSKVLLLRHPCSVVTSQLAHGNWEEYVKAETMPFLIPDCRNKEFFMQYEDVIKSVKYPEENLAAMWALTMVNTVMHPYNDIKWVTVSYESLVINPEKQLNRIADRLGFDLELDKNSKSVFRKPSFTTNEFTKDDISTNSQLTRWKSMLTPVQISRILNIIKEFGIDFYDEGIEPDYSKILKS